MTSYWFSFFFPWLLVFSVFQYLTLRGTQERQTQWPLFLGFGLAAAVVVVLPIQGIPLGRWMAGLNFQPSIPLLGLIVHRVWKSSFQTELFRPEDRKASWLCGGVMGTALYPLALGAGHLDPYALGWNFTVLFPIIALLTVMLIWNRNRFGLLLLFSIIACDLHLLESPNFWDYLIDPLFWLLSLTFLATSALKQMRGRKTCSPVENPVEKACH